MRSVGGRAVSGKIWGMLSVGIRAWESWGWIWSKGWNWGELVLELGL